MTDTKDGYERSLCGRSKHKKARRKTERRSKGERRSGRGRDTPKNEKSAPSAAGGHFEHLI